MNGSVVNSSTLLTTSGMVVKRPPPPLSSSDPIEFLNFEFLPGAMQTSLHKGEEIDPNTLLGTLYFLIILAVFLTFAHRRRFYRLSRTFPGPLELPIIGSFHRIGSANRIIPRFTELHQIYPIETIFSYFGPQPSLYTIDPYLIELILREPELYNKPNILYGPLSFLFGDGLFSASHAKWKNHRKMINPSFRRPILRQFCTIFNKNALRLKSNMEQFSGKGEVTLIESLQKCTLITAIETVLGNEMQPSEDQISDLAKSYCSATQGIMAMVLLNLFKMSSMAKHLKFYTARGKIINFVDKVLKQRLSNFGMKNNKKMDCESKESMENNQENSKTPDENDESIYLNENSQQIFIDRLLKNFQNKNLNYQDAMDESTSVLFASFETTATSVYFNLMLLAMHPDIQEKLFEEIKGFYPDTMDFEVRFEDLDKFEYLNKVVNETLRILPPIPTVARGVDKDIVLKNGILLPHGLLVAINIFEVHRNEKHWGTNTTEFDPERFSAEKVKDRHPYAFLPFNKGVRNCIGEKYALVAIKVFLIHLIRNYKYSTNFKFENLQFINNIIMRLKVYPLLSVEKRLD